jgi:hypothetical protein
LDAIIEEARNRKFQRELTAVGVRNRKYPRGYDIEEESANRRTREHFDCPGISATVFNMFKTQSRYAKERRRLNFGM